jgi:hypothetical protein
MQSFSIDYDKLSNSIKYAEKVVFKLSDVKHKLEKVAFDVFRMNDGKPDELWEIQNSDDGDYIVARYNIEETTDIKTSSTNWEVLTTAASDSINVFYKGHPITKIASAKEDIDTVKRFLPSKLASDKNFVSALLSTLDDASKATIYKLYPELS